MDTVTATREAPDAALAATLRRHLAEAMAQGITCVKTKTGYGRTVVDEERSARIAAEVVDEVTFLGAHLVPPDVLPADYLCLGTGEMLDAVAPHVSWVDVGAIAAPSTPMPPHRCPTVATLLPACDLSCRAPLLDAPSAVHLAYRPGVPLTWAVWRRGRRVV